MFKRNWFKWVFSKKYRTLHAVRRHLPIARKVRRTLGSIKLPPRFPSGDDRNWNRVAVLLGIFESINKEETTKKGGEEWPG